MTTSRVSGKDPLANIETKLILGLRQEPYVGLVAVIDWSWERILWSKAVIDADNRDSKVDSPPSSVILVRARISHDEATSMEFQNCKVTLLRILN